MLTSSQLNNPPFSRDRVNAADFYIDTQYRLIYEDEAILVIDKPAPLAVHPVGSYVENNLHSLLKKDPRWSGIDIRFMHRLDAETSGVILIAKNYEAARFIGKEFLASRVQKTYEALVFGVPTETQGEIVFRLGKDVSSGFQTVRIRDEENGEEARTLYRTLSRETHASGTEYSRVELSPLTGRTHQLRVHMALLGNPIVGDKIYIDLNHFKQYVVHGMSPAMLDVLKLKRLALHATRLSFIHPLKKERVEYGSDCPDFLKEIRS